MRQQYKVPQINKPLQQQNRQSPVQVVIRSVSDEDPIGHMTADNGHAVFVTEKIVLTKEINENDGLDLSTASKYKNKLLKKSMKAKYKQGIQPPPIKRDEKDMPNVENDADTAFLAKVGENIAKRREEDWIAHNKPAPPNMPPPIQASIVDSVNIASQRRSVLAERCRKKGHEYFDKYEYDRKRKLEEEQAERDRMSGSTN